MVLTTEFVQIVAALVAEKAFKNGSVNFQFKNAANQHIRNLNQIDIWRDHFFPSKQHQFF